MENLLTLTEVSEILNISKQTLRNWDKNGKLKAIKTEGGHRRYKREDILSLSKGLKNKDLFKRINGEKWYLRDFDFLPEPISDRAPWIYDNDAISAFKQNNFKWFDTYDECAEASVFIRKYLGIGHIDDSERLTSRKDAFRNCGYMVD